MRRILCVPSQSCGTLYATYMTFEAGTILDITETCDKVLEYFYFRKSSTVDLDQAQMELTFAFERFDIAIKKLERDGHINITRTKTHHFGQITPDGEVFYRTASYQRLAQTTEETNRRTRRKENFDFAKGIIEILIGIVTVALTIWTLTLDKKIDRFDDKINKLQNALDSVSKNQNYKSDTSAKNSFKLDSASLK